MKNRKVFRASLALYDFLIFSAVAFVLYWLYNGAGKLSLNGFICQCLVACVSILGVRIAGNVYRQIWRYGGIQCYIRLLLCDVLSGCQYSIYRSFSLSLSVQ